MDPRRAQVERNAHFTRGPRFFREGEAVLFEFVIDATNVLGPRPANDGDRRIHAEAWREFSRGEALAVLAAPNDDAVFVSEPVYQAVLDHIQGPPAKRAYNRRKPREETI